MLRQRGDLWELYDAGEAKIVVTTNIGWDPHDYQNNMGAGMALQAARRYPELPYWYGMFCRENLHGTPVVERYGLVFLPVKPLKDMRDPERSWDQLASVPLIERGLRQLLEVEGEIALAYPGCGNGGLGFEQVEPLLERYLGPHDRFRLVDRRLKTDLELLREEEADDWLYAD